MKLSNRGTGVPPMVYEIEASDECSKQRINQDPKGRTDQGADSQRRARDFPRAWLRRNDDASHCQKSGRVPGQRILLLRLEGTSHSGVLSPHTRTTPVGNRGRTKTGRLESSPADIDAAQDLDPCALSRVCR